MTSPSDSIEALVEKIGSCMATLQPSRQLDQEASEALTALADRVREAERWQNESREGLVSVFNHEGEYVGCMGEKTWQWILDGGKEKLKERAKAAERARDFWEKEAARHCDHAEAYEAEAKALREALREIEVLLDSPRAAEPFVRGQALGEAQRALRVT